MAGVTKQCPSCGKGLTPTEDFFGKCQVCHSDLDAMPPKDDSENTDAEK